MKSVCVYVGALFTLSAAWLSPVTADTSPVPGSVGSPVFPLIPLIVPAPEWQPTTPADMALRRDVRNLIAEPPRTPAEARKLMLSALCGDAEALAKMIAYWKGRLRLPFWDRAFLAALSGAERRPERGAVDLPPAEAQNAGTRRRMMPPLPLPLRELPPEQSERLASLPPSAWSTEELLNAALHGEEQAAAELAYYWTCRRKLSDLGGEDRRAPWRSDAEHWSERWMAVWKSGSSYGVLASRLEEGAKLSELPANPAWVELMGASARGAEGDAVRDSLQAVAAVLPGVQDRETARELAAARREGVASLLLAARQGKQGAAARYYSLIAAGRKQGRERREAGELLRQAARSGDVAALRTLAATVPADEAQQLRARAIDLGDVQTMREELAGLPPDSERASRLRRRLADRGDLEELMRSAEEILSLPAGPGRTEKLPEAEKYLKRAAEQGLGRASLLLCRLYEGGFGGEATPEKACVTARNMVAAHYAPGYLKMAEYKERGYGNCSRDLVEAYSLIEAAARSRMPRALVQWARVLLRGIGTDPDPASAARILDYVRSVAPETPSLNFYLGYMYETGVGKPRDLGKALRYYTAGVEQGDSRAMNNLASMYEAGVGVAADREKALQLYERAARLGNEDSLANHARLKAGK